MFIVVEMLILETREFVLRIGFNYLSISCGNRYLQIIIGNAIICANVVVKSVITIISVI